MSDALVRGQAARQQLYLLGGIQLRGPQEPDRLLAQSKTVALLAYLALAPEGRFQRRDRLVALLWPEFDQPHARAALRKTIFAIRAVLGAQVIRARGDEEIALDWSALWCDATEFIVCAENGMLARAAELYRGE